MKSEPFTFASTFAGIGGFDLAFTRAGMTCVWQSENDEYASNILARHFPDVMNYGDRAEVRRLTDNRNMIK